jgi:hypothetical protein
MSSLIRWLGAATGNNSDAQVIKYAKHAYYLSAKLVPHPQKQEHENLRTDLMQFWSNLSDLPCPIPVTNSTPAGNVDKSALKLRYHWPRILQESDKQLNASPGFLILDRSAVTEEKEYHLAWRSWLRYFNLFQMLPGVYLATADGLEAGDFQSIRSLRSKSSPNLTHPILSRPEWDEILNLTLPDLIDDIKSLRELGVPSPDEVGYELSVDTQIVAEAELAWTDKKVALLLSDTDAGSAFRKQGWSTVEVSAGWPEKIANILL